MSQLMTPCGWDSCWACGWAVQRQSLCLLFGWDSCFFWLIYDPLWLGKLLSLWLSWRQGLRLGLIYGLVYRANPVPEPWKIVCSWRSLWVSFGYPMVAPEPWLSLWLRLLLSMWAVTSTNGLVYSSSRKQMWLETAQVWELSRLCPKTSTILYVHKFGFPTSLSLSWNRSSVDRLLPM